MVKYEALKELFPKKTVPFGCISYPVGTYEQLLIMKGVLEREIIRYRKKGDKCKTMKAMERNLNRAEVLKAIHENTLKALEAHEAWLLGEEDD